MAYGDLKDLSSYDGYQRALDSLVHKFFDKKYSGGAAKSETIPKQELAEQFHKLLEQ